ncbi:MAG: hypothetical protein ABI321_04065, partial [Polyangia bacterium]
MKTTLVPSESHSTSHKSSLVCKAVFAACLSTLLLAGCGTRGGALDSSGTWSAAAQRMGGSVHGGYQPIYNGTVTLYGMNTSTTSYGDAPTQY